MKFAISELTPDPAILLRITSRPEVATSEVLAFAVDTVPDTEGELVDRPTELWFPPTTLRPATEE